VSGVRWFWLLAKLDTAPAVPAGTMAALANDRIVRRVEGGDKRLRRTRWPQRQQSSLRDALGMLCAGLLAGVLLVLWPVGRLQRSPCWPRMFRRGAQLARTPW
jgi:hypothetical protein